MELLSTVKISSTETETQNTWPAAEGCDYFCGTCITGYQLRYDRCHCHYGQPELPVDLYGGESSYFLLTKEALSLRRIALLGVLRCLAALVTLRLEFDEQPATQNSH